MRRKFDHQKPITADFSIVLKAAVRKFSFPSSKGQKIFKSNAENLLNQQEKRGKMIRKLSKTIEDIYLLSLPRPFFFLAGQSQV